MPEESYPVSERFKVLGGYDIYRSAKLIVAIVAVEGPQGKDIRLYRWRNRSSKDGESVWKVDLARMSIARWDWKKVAEKIAELREKFGINQGPRAEEN